MADRKGKGKTRRRSGNKDVSVEESDGESKVLTPVKGATRRARHAPSKNQESKEPEQSKELENNKAIDQFVNTVTDLGVAGLRKMFNERLAMMCPPTQKCTSFEENTAKNRYLDIVCLEETRVVLEKENPADGDYIHANWVKFEKHDRKFIATQAPLPHTCVDFWRMVWQNKCPTIVCLTKTVEDNKMKCAQYWPENAGDFANHGLIKIVNKKIETDDKFSIYTFDVSQTDCADGLVVKMIHVTSWPDKGIPLSGMMILRMIRSITTVDPLAVGPVVVHCSAGISRTGTIILIDVILHRLFKNSMEIDLPELFKNLRLQRASCIQKEGHFVFLVSTVLDYIRARVPGKFKEKVDKFKEEFKAAQLQQA